jgi:outer membrane protein assembly factor BamB
MGVAGAALLPTPTQASAVAPPRPPDRVDTTPLRFAVITDTHEDIAIPERAQQLTRLLTVAEGMNPDFVLHCGDITDYGVDDEFALYRSAVPNTLWDRMHHAPGNHEARWTPDAFETYRRYFGPEWTSFELHGLRVAGLAPMQLLQEPGLFGAEGLDRVSDALRGSRNPAVMFLHYPLGADNYFVNDTEDFLDRIAGRQVRALFAGHIHRQQVDAFNGLTQVAMRNTYAVPSFYWAERSSDGRRLDVSEVTAPATGTPASTTVTSIPLDRTGPGEALEPRWAKADAGRETIALSASFAVTPAKVLAQVYPQGVFGGTSKGTWVPLTAGPGQTWRGDVSTTGLAPGEHRIQLRAFGTDGTAFDRTLPVKLRSASTTVSWTAELRGAIQGALLATPSGFVAATTAGQVEAFTATGRSIKRRWHRTIGAVHRAPALMDKTVLLPSIDHRLYALDAAKGSVRWTANLSAPVLSSPLVTKVDGSYRVLVSAGGRLHCLDEHGKRLWSSDLHGLFAGKVACDGDRVFAGGGDGNAHAFDARTGAELWSVSTSTKTTPYQRLIYGAWNDVIELLPDGSVLVSTVANAQALDPATGAVRWQRAGSYIYTPSVLTDYGILLFDEQGKAVMADPATGAVKWTTAVAPRSFEAGPVLSADGRTAWHVGGAGLLSRLDLATGTTQPLLQVSKANTFSTPVLVGKTLVIGFQDGVLRGVSGL